MHNTSIGILKRQLVRWILFFLICAGLGYPTLLRYDPRITGGITDADEYYPLVAATDLLAAKSLLEDDDPRPRLMVPLAARVFHKIINGHTGEIDAGLLALLLANAFFCATIALLLVELGTHTTGSEACALLAATLYLLNFAVSNYYMAALVDSGEACMLLLLTWALLAGRWHLLPLIGLIGAFSKETFVPFAAVYSTAWYWQMVGIRIADYRFKWWISLNVSAIGMLIVLWSFWYRQWVLPWTIATEQHANDTGFLQGLWDCVANHGVLYLFGWLLPLGIWRLRQLPSAWVFPSLATGMFALLMGAWDDSGSNIARALFNISGPVLSLSVAVLLTGTINRSGSGNPCETDGTPS